MQNMDKANTITIMANSTLDNGVTIRRMVREHTSTWMEIDMWVVGCKIKRMEKESSTMEIRVFTQVFILPLPFSGCFK